MQYILRRFAINDGEDEKNANPPSARVCYTDLISQHLLIFSVSNLLNIIIKEKFGTITIF